MATIVIEKLDGTVERWSYHMWNMILLINNIHGDKPTIKNYYIEGIHREESWATN